MMPDIFFIGTFGHALSVKTVRPFWLREILPCGHLRHKMSYPDIAFAIASIGLYASTDRFC